MSNTPLISVIVPVYNVAEYLPRCLDSICNQTYPNLEIILVDDGSTDNSLQICNQYAAKDKRITVIHQENGGLSAARNTGMDHMHGEFFTFIDSDDWISLDYCQVLLDLINQSGVEVACGNFIFAYQNTDRHTPPCITYPAGVHTGEICLQFFLNYFQTVWGKLYRTAPLGTLRFKPYYSINEDVDFSFQVGKTIRSFVFTQSALYYYFQRGNSLVRAIDIPGRKKIFELLEQIESFCREKKHFISAEETHQVWLNYGCRLAALSILNNSLGREENQALQNKMHTWLRKHKQEIFALPTLQFFGHTFMRCFYYFPRITTFLCRLPLIRPRLQSLFFKRTTNQ